MRAQPRSCRPRSGFTLVEMAIVLLIIGLIVGGIFAGQELYRASQINSVAVDLTRFRTAMDAFKLKYRALPGDMADATHYFGAVDTPSGGCPNGTGTGTLTCDGNGNGRIGEAGSEYESLRAWQHLAASGLIAQPKNGYFTGRPGASGIVNSAYGEHVYGTNAPESRLKKVGYAIFYIGLITSPTDAAYFTGEYGNAITVGARIGAAASKRSGDGYYYPDNFAFTTTEAQTLDRKYDDGLPGLGRIRARIGATTSAMPDCTTGLTAADGATAVYKTALDQTHCFLHFLRAAE